MYFLIFPSLIFSGASLINKMYPTPLMMGGIFFVNAVGMVLITASLGYKVMILGKRVTFGSFFSIYAFSSGVASDSSTSRNV